MIGWGAKTQGNLQLEFRKFLLRPKEHLLRVLRSRPVRARRESVSVRNSVRIPGCISSIELPQLNRESFVFLARSHHLSHLPRAFQSAVALKSRCLEAILKIILAVNIARYNDIVCAQSTDLREIEIPLFLKPFKMCTHLFQLSL